MLFVDLHRDAAKPNIKIETEQARVDVLQKVIEKCVDAVHRSAPEDELNAQFFSGFDAFYNVASGTVQDNNRFVGGMPAKYAFQKCMSKNGFPLH